MAAKKPKTYDTSFDFGSLAPASKSIDTGGRRKYRSPVSIFDTTSGVKRTGKRKRRRNSGTGGS